MNASVGLALLTGAIEEKHHVMGFTGGRGMGPVAISPSMRLDQAVEVVERMDAGPTDCALPMLYALEKGLKVEVFQIFTDNETSGSSMHPCQALNLYREKTGIDAKLVVIAMESNGFSIADPKDAGMMDVVGFDTHAPAAIADFARG